MQMVQMLKSAKDSAVMARTQVLNQMKALIIKATAQFGKPSMPSLQLH